MNYLRKKKNELRQTQMEQVNYCPHSPILIEADGRILFGNAYWEAIGEEVECLIIENHCLNDAIIELERDLQKFDINERSARYEAFDNVFYMILKNAQEEEDKEENLMFDFMSHEKNNDFITKENYMPPPPPIWKKAQKTELYEEGEQFLL